MNDLVSIITPSYNTAKYIGETIRSVLDQTYQNWELIIVDDCSKDDTDAVVSSFSDERIRYLKNEKNSGAAVSRNYALREAKGRWIAFLDSDDLWLPEKLEKQVAFMEDGGYAFSYTGYKVVNEQSISTGQRVTGPRHINRIGMYLYNWLGCLTVMYDAEKVGLVQIPDLKKANDYAIWLQVIRKADCHYLGEDLSRYRKRSGSLSHDSLKKQIRAQYDLFRIGDQRGVASSFLLMSINLFFGVMKKILFVRSD